MLLDVPDVPVLFCALPYSVLPVTRAVSRYLAVISVYAEPMRLCISDLPKLF